MTVLSLTASVHYIAGGPACLEAWQGTNTTILYRNCIIIVIVWRCVGVCSKVSEKTTKFEHKMYMYMTIRTNYTS